MRLFFCIATITKQTGFDTNITVQQGVITAQDSEKAVGMMMNRLREMYPNGLISYGPAALDVTDDVRTFANLYPEPKIAADTTDAESA